MSERDLAADQVRDEHVAEVHVGAHWLYLAAVPGIGFAVMLVLLALLDAT